MTSKMKIVYVITERNGSQVLEPRRRRVRQQRRIHQREARRDPRQRRAPASRLRAARRSDELLPRCRQRHRRLARRAGVKETRAMQFVGLPSERAETAVDEALRPASHRRRCDTDDDNLASGGGGRRSALAARPATQSLVTRLRRSVWAPVALRAAGIAAGLLGLAAVGAASTLNGEGIEVAATSSASPARPPSESAAEAAMGAAWLSAGPEQAAKGKSAPSEPSHDSKPRKSAEPVPQGEKPRSHRRRSRHPQHGERRRAHEAAERREEARRGNPRAPSAAQALSPTYGPAPGARHWRQNAEEDASAPGRRPARALNRSLLLLAPGV